jgi:hypothetical protein
VVPKLLWICTRVKVEVINNKTTWVRVKSTGGKTYLSKKYKVSLKNILKKYKVKVKVLLSVACRGGGGTSPMDWHTKDTKQHTHYMRAPNIQYGVYECQTATSGLRLKKLFEINDCMEIWSCIYFCMNLK